MTVYVITHKPIESPLDKGYTPMLIGADFNKNPKHYMTDNTGRNISSKNKEYCELTGLYWMWKNSTEKNVGLNHYRRFFFSHDIGGRNAMYLWLLITGRAHTISENTLSNWIDTKKYDWIVAHPERMDAKPLYKQFILHHNEKDLEHTRDAIKKLYPDYLPSYDKFLHSKASMSPYNMFYTSKENMDEYCEWLFNILFEVEKHSDLSGYDDYQRRLFGFLGERLFNVWLMHHSNLKIKYLTVYNTSDTNRAEMISHVKNGIKKVFHK